MKFLCGPIVSTVCVVILAIPAFAQSPKMDNADQMEIKTFRLNTDRLNKYAVATKSLLTFARERSELQQKMENEPEAKTIDQTVGMMDKYPTLVSAIRSAGLSPREYAVMTMTLVSTLMTVSMTKQVYSKDMPAGVSAENVAFVEQNLSKIQEVMINLQAAHQ